VSTVLSSPYFTIPAVAWLAAQIIKVVADSVQHRRIDIRRLASAGGMPSSHTSLVLSLTTVIGARRGLDSPEFAIAAVFSSVVMYDATGVRRAAGRQARVINRIIDDLFHQEGIKEERLRELIGHTPVEVIAGALLGILIALVMLGR
jgi:acid phosphatase family membrane protein YuiD